MNACNYNYNSLVCHVWCVLCMSSSSCVYLGCKLEAVVHLRIIFAIALQCPYASMHHFYIYMFITRFHCTSCHSRPLTLITWCKGKQVCCQTTIEAIMGRCPTHFISNAQILSPKKQHIPSTMTNLTSCRHSTARELSTIRHYCTDNQQTMSTLSNHLSDRRRKEKQVAMSVLYGQKSGTRCHLNCENTSGKQ